MLYSAAMFQVCYTLLQCLNYARLYCNVSSMLDSAAMFQVCYTLLQCLNYARLCCYVSSMLDSAAMFQVCYTLLQCFNYVRAGLANPRLPSRMRLFAWFHAALTFISKFVFVFFFNVRVRFA